MNPVKLIGLDFGTTTSSAVIATTQLVRNAVTGRTELSQIHECYRSDIIFTPLRDNRLDLAQVRGYLEAWLEAGQVVPEEIFGGGALLTGLTAQKENASALVQLIREHLHDALIATADDPRLESWLAFMGSCAGLSRAHPHQPFLNLDIGGGTTNLALGQAGEVQRTGCLFVGARHVQVEPGTYRIVHLSSYVSSLLDHHGIAKQPGDSLTASDVAVILDFYQELLEAATTGQADIFQTPLAHRHQQIPLEMPPQVTPIVTLSGGVGELVYHHLQGQPWPATTCFGDLGIDLARRIIDSGLWADDLRAWQPAGLGRATVYGLLRHTTQVSGTTVYLADPSVLPLIDLPILGTIGADATDADIRSVIDLVRRVPQGGGVRVRLAETSAAAVAVLGQRISQALRAEDFPPYHPLVLFLGENLGKVMGNYATGWGTVPLRLVVVDEMTVPNAQYARIGRLQNQVLPVAFYGLNDWETKS